MPAYHLNCGVLLTAILFSMLSTTAFAFSIPEEYADAVIRQHNLHRANHSAPALVWDAELAAIAQKHAKKCDFEHTPDGKEGGQYGENLAYWASTGDIAKKKIYAARRAITNGWYNKEQPFYTSYGDATPPNYEQESDKYGHFTQVVWKSSVKVGCGSILCAAGKIARYPAWYTVCNYDPPGNVEGEYGENVLEPLGLPVQVISLT